MFGIQEFSKLSQISAMMLQYYANSGILTPDWIEPISGGRYYLAEQIKVAEKINALRDFGFSISEISVLQGNWDDDNIQKEIERKRTSMESEIDQLKRKINSMEQYISIIEGKAILDVGAARLKNLQEGYIYSVRLTEHISRSESMLWHRLKQCMEKQELSEIGIYTMFSYDSEYKDQSNDAELGLMVKEDIKSCTEADCRKVEAVMAVCCRTMGGEDKIRRAYRNIAIWLDTNSEYKMSGPIRKVFRKKIEHSKGAEQNVIEVQVPVCKE